MVNLQLVLMAVVLDHVPCGGQGFTALWPEWLELKWACLLSSLFHLHVWYSYDVSPPLKRGISAVPDTVSLGFGSLEGDR